jgi:uncharacterized protein YdiU (UPF0061 family)
MKFNHTYQNLGSEFFEASQPAFFSEPNLIKLNTELALNLGFDFNQYSEIELAKIFTGQKLLVGANPISTVYAAHQFGHFVPILGDGRAMLLGEVKGKCGQLFDVQLKGAGPTRYSRRGDGFSALGPVLREYLVSEFIHRLNIPSTRALAAVATNQKVYRESALPGGVFTRVAKSHIRIGTFQYFWASKNFSALKSLLRYSIERHYPEILNKNFEEKDYSLLFLQNVIKRQVSLVSSWMSIGFIHGVMNTDNMTISGETIDFGPCAFMDYFDYQQVYSFIDRNGRYSFINQPNILGWNLSRLADTLIPQFVQDANISEAEAIKIFNLELEKIPTLFENELISKFALKISMTHLEFVEQKNIVLNFLDLLAENKIDFTSSFRFLSGALRGNRADLPNTLIPFFDHWSTFINDKFESANQMDAINPVYIPRNHLIEEFITAAYNNDYSLFHKMNEVLESPFVEVNGLERFARPPTKEQIVQNTFCGT